jgi:hypothetical protein
VGLEYVLLVVTLGNGGVADVVRCVLQTRACRISVPACGECLSRYRAVETIGHANCEMHCDPISVFSLREVWA